MSLVSIFCRKPSRTHNSLRNQYSWLWPCCHIHASQYQMVPPSFLSNNRNGDHILLFMGTGWDRWSSISSHLLSLDMMDEKQTGLYILNRLNMEERKYTNENFCLPRCSQSCRNHRQNLHRRHHHLRNSVNDFCKENNVAYYITNIESSWLPKSIDQTAV